MFVVLVCALSVAEASPAGDALAARAVALAGDPTTLDELRFTFIVEVEGVEKVRRSYIWSPARGELNVQRGDELVALGQLHSNDLSAASLDPERSAAVWAAVSPGSTPNTAAQAWSWFINDSYWLLAPSKLLDPGVLREVASDGRLVVGFAGVGLTPGDQYTLTLDPVTGDLLQWDYLLQGGSVGSFVWEEPLTAGPLHLRLRRTSADGTRVIRFEDVSAR